MPTTITSYYTFTANTKAKASEVNTNFNNYRGTVLPIDPNTVSAVDNTYDHGSSEYYWKRGYYGGIDLKSSTSTADLVLSGDITTTLGSFKFEINSTTVGRIDSEGFDLSYAKPSSIDTTGSFATGVLPNLALTGQYSANATLTLTGNINALIVDGWGGGGGGGGGGQGAAGTGGSGGGGGASGAYTQYVIYSLTTGDVLSITVGDGGAGGAGGTSGSGGVGGNGNTGNNSSIRINGATTYVFPGGERGFGGTISTSGSGGTSDRQGSFLLKAYGGAGGLPTVAGSSGQSSAHNSGGAGGSGGAAGTGGGGGGGGSSNLIGFDGGAGGNGGLSGGTGGTATDGAATCGGGGGGGGGAGNFNGGVGQSGGAGFVRIFEVK